MIKIDDVTFAYKAQVSVLSPVHIGSGDRYSPHFHHYAADEYTLHVTSQQKILQVLSGHPERIKEFVAFCGREDGKLENLIKNWQNVYFSTISAYRMFCEMAPGEVRAFMRQYDGAGAAFLPGSSLKGAIRSALLRFAYSSSSQMQTDLEQDLANYDGLSHDGARAMARQKIETRLFTNLTPDQADAKSPKHANHDLLRLLQFSDSAPLPNNWLFVAPVLVYSSQSSKRLKQRFQTPTYVEALRPEVTFELSAAIHQYLRSDIAKPILQRIGKQGRYAADFIYVCREVGKALAQQELAFYQYHLASGDQVAQAMTNWFSNLLAQIDKLCDAEAILPMGWGSGYDAKTVTDLIGNALMERVTEREQATRKLGRPSGSRDMLPDPLVPKTRKIATYKKSLYPMGWVKLMV